MTGFSNSAATSRKMWMLSASSICRWLSLGAPPTGAVWVSSVGNLAPLWVQRKTARQRLAAVGVLHELCEKASRAPYYSAKKTHTRFERNDNEQHLSQQQQPAG